MTEPLLIPSAGDWQGPDDLPGSSTPGTNAPETPAGLGNSRVKGQVEKTSNIPAMIVEGVNDNGWLPNNSSYDCNGSFRSTAPPAPCRLFRLSVFGDARLLPRQSFPGMPGKPHAYTMMP